MDRVSVIIPTRNRRQSLRETLAALSKQKAAIHEVIVIDASDPPIDPSELNHDFAFNACLLLHAKASVCAQRNTGIRRATGDFVLLLDDDISVDDNYIALCLGFFREHPAALAASGLVLEKRQSGNWEARSPTISFRQLAWAFVFQSGLWNDLAEVKKTWMNAFFLERIQRHCSRCGNGISKAGWPELTQFQKPVFRSQIYYLGASMIRRDWLLANLYSEKLD
jgi:glycosyltransferase involved in cell wall biosynthesis